MSSTYFTLLTSSGASAMAYAAAHSTPVALSQVAFGDGNGVTPVPTIGTTALVNEVYRANINSIIQDINNPNWFIIEMLLPPTVGGFTIREFRVDDANGVCIYAGNCAPEVKPLLPDGMTRDSVYHLIVETSNSATINLIVDTSITIATHDYVDNKFLTDGWKDPVRVATTVNCALSGLLAIDDIVTVAGDRVLVKNQTTGSANGIYTVSTGAWTRATDCDTSAKAIPSFCVSVQEGTVASDSIWMLTTDRVVVLGTTALVFQQVAGKQLVTLTQPPGTNNTTNASTAFVQYAIGGFLSKSVAGSANVTLTAVEAGGGIIRLTGALTGNIQVIVPIAIPRSWIFDNQTTGAFTITIKTPSGSGVLLVQGFKNVVFTDATNCFNSNTELGTETKSGVAYIATLAEVQSGLNDQDYVTPLKLRTGSLRETDITSSATITPTADLSDVYAVTALAVAATIAAPTFASAALLPSQALLIRIKDNGTARAITWNAIYRQMGVILPTTTISGKTVLIGMFYNSADNKWDVIGVNQEP